MTPDTVQTWPPRGVGGNFESEHLPRSTPERSTVRGGPPARAVPRSSPSVVSPPVVSPLGR
jgi:hypothetical protein